MTMTFYWSLLSSTDIAQVLRNTKPTTKAAVRSAILEAGQRRTRPYLMMSSLKLRSRRKGDRPAQGHRTGEPFLRREPAAAPVPVQLTASFTASPASSMSWPAPRNILHEVADTITTASTNSISSFFMSISSFHAYPWLIHRLTYRRTNHDNLYVRGYKEEGTTTTPFDMTVRNDLDRFHLVMDTIDRLPQTGDKGIYLKPQLKDKLTEHKQYIDKHGEDMPDIRNWKWELPHE